LDVVQVAESRGRMRNLVPRSSLYEATAGVTNLKADPFGLRDSAEPPSLAAVRQSQQELGASEDGNRDEQDLKRGRHLVFFLGLSIVTWAPVSPFTIQLLI